METATIGFAIGLLALSASFSVGVLLVVCVALARQLASTHKAWAEARNAYMATSTDMARMVRFMEESPMMRGPNANGQDDPSEEAMKQQMGERYRRLVEDQRKRDQEDEADEIAAGNKPGAEFTISSDRM